MHKYFCYAELDSLLRTLDTNGFVSSSGETISNLYLAFVEFLLTENGFSIKIDSCFRLRNKCPYFPLARMILIVGSVDSTSKIL
jgi:hypothetical protein